MKAILGHAEIRRSLGALIRDKAFPQTSLFYGIAGCGKKLVALEAAQTLLCEVPAENAGLFLACGKCRSCETFMAGNHPDFHLISDTPAKSKSGKTSKGADDDEDSSPANSTASKSSGTIKTEQIVELKKRIAYPPLMGKFHVTLIDNADLMTETTANSLLKLLEEPRREQIFILVSGRFHRLLVTIRSRAAKFHFKSLGAEDCRRIVDKLGESDEAGGVDEKLWKFYADCFPGSPSLIREALQLPLESGDFEKILARRDGFAATQNVVKRVLESGAEPQLFLQVLRGFCLNRAVTQGGATGRDADFLDRITVAQKRLERHIPAEFVLENLFL